MRYPVIVTVITTTIMLSLAFPLLHIQLGINNVRPANLEGTQARNLLEQKWPQGSQLKLQVVITQYDQPQTQAKAETFKNTLLAVPGLSGPVETSISQDGKVGLLSFIQSGTLNDQANWNTVDRIRKAIVPQYFNKAGGPQAYVSGLSAVVVDQNKFFINPTVWIFVLALSFLVLLVVFRSLVIAVKAILLNLLTTGAAYGAVILVFQDGLLWVKPTGLLESWLPVLIFTIIFGLSMDYHLFILTRIKELRDQGYNTNKAVALGISSTSGTITGAAAIMVVVFGDFFVGVDLVSIQQLGLGLAVAVFLDATIVRSMLLPAVMGLMGEANWWLPKFLNWLPNITIESEPEAVETTPEPAVALLDRV
jgi:RND superfamily putative drug exporter